MRRGAKPAKAKAEAKLPVARKSRKNEASTVRDLGKRLAEALEQQTATAEILRLIGSSPMDAQPVFAGIARSAARLCSAQDVFILCTDGDIMRLGAGVGPLSVSAPADFAVPISRGSVSGRAVLERRTLHVLDLAAEPDNEFPVGKDLQRRFGHRTMLATPLLRESMALGVICVLRTEVRPFTDSQIDLLRTLADQAVIAIENVRLFNETKETLEQQTATAEILRVISRSPTDVQPIFDAIVESALRLCDGLYSGVYRVEGDMVHLVAHNHRSPESLRGLGRAWPMPVQSPASPICRAIRERAVVHVSDTESDPTVPESARERSRSVDQRSVLAVPMLREGVPIGAIRVSRREPKPFSDTQIELLKTFADQAVIAIENVRLFTELQIRNRDLTVALDRQTATSEILRVISGSTTDVQPVFDTIVRRAVQLCRGYFGLVMRFDGELMHLVAHCNFTPEALAVFGRLFPRPPSPESIMTRAVLARSVVHVPDIEHAADFLLAHKLSAALGARAVVGVPMLREGEPIGVIGVAREEPGPFSDTEIELLQTFASQAVIAIENVRLFKELEARTADLTRSVEQLTALGEVGRAVSSTLDLETVLTTIVARAVELSRLDGGVVFEYDEGAQEFVQRAATETGGALAEARRATRIPKGEGVLGRTAITLEPVQVPDITVAGAYESRLRENLIESGIRAILAVPMVREGRLIGCLGVTRNRSGEFPLETIDLLRTFATQSALAIQNARLYRELEQKGRELEAASRHKSEFLANMSHELRTPLNAIIGFSEVLADRMFGEVNEKQAEYLQDILSSGRHLLSLINDILDLSKVEAGRLELELSRFHLPTALDNALTLVRERASRHGIGLDLAVAAGVGDVVGDERKIRQILLNLLANAVKFTREGGRVGVTATAADDVITVSVSDTGIGIAPEDQEAIFEEFRQVGRDDVRKQEGTGLGLTLAKKFVELHGGRIWVQSQVGQGATFTFTLPVRPEGRSSSDQGGGVPPLNS